MQPANQMKIKRSVEKMRARTILKINEGRVNYEDSLIGIAMQKPQAVG